MIHSPTVLTIAAALALWTPGAATAAEPPAKRARPPQWTADLDGVFFEDARAALVGERPASGKPAATAADPLDNAGSAASNVPPAADIRWSQLVDGETLAAEVKRQAIELNAPLANPSAFKSGGYLECRDAFNMLAVLFTTIAQYDGQVRWQSSAPGLREALSRAAARCQSGSDEALVEAMQRKADLDDLIRGQPLDLPAAAAPPPWSAIADRPLLMQFMERSLQERIPPALASQRELSQRSADLREQAQLLALLAEVIQRDDFADWDDPPFKQHAGQLRAAAAQLDRAAAEAQLDKARAALTRIDQACTDCHADYRG